MTIVEQLFQELDVLLNNYVFQAYHALSSFLKTPLSLAISLYIIVLGVSISQGWIKLSVSNLVKSTLKIGIIYTAAMNWSWFSQYFVSTINNGAGEIGSVLVSATPVPIPHFAGEGINGAMQSVMIEVTKIGAWTWDMGSWHNFGPRFTALMIWGFGYAYLLVSIFELVVAKIMLAILLATAPLFISFTLFKTTHGFFDKWLGACVGFALLQIFVSAFLALALSISQWAIGGTYVSHAMGITLVGFVPMMIVGFIILGSLLKVSQLAQSIGGVVSTSSASTLLAGAIGGAIGGSISTLKSSGKGVKSMFGSAISTGKLGTSLFGGIRRRMNTSTLRGDSNKNG